MSAPGTDSKPRFELSPRMLAAAVLTILAAIFILQNRNSTSIDLFWVSVQSPLWLTLIVVFAVGWVTGLLMARRAKKA
ncbi:LapA family protein [Prescottella defluvii]|nr:LapA family protein [Prescottella defluvii]